MFLSTVPTMKKTVNIQVFRKHDVSVTVLIKKVLFSPTLACSSAGC